MNLPVISRLSLVVVFALVLAACGSSSTGSTGGGAGGGSGGGSGGGKGGGSGGGASGEGMLTASIHRPSGYPEPAAIYLSFKGNGASSLYSAPDAGTSTWYTDLPPSTFALSKAQDGMTAEATFTSTRTSKSMTFNIHGAATAPASSNAGATIGFVELRPCFKQAGATMITFNFACSSTVEPAGTGQSSTSVRVGNPADYCNYGSITGQGNTILVTPDKRSGSITTSADSDGYACLSGVDVQVVSAAGSVTDSGGTSTVNTVITITASAQ